MREVDFVNLECLDEIAVYINGVFEETIPYLTVDDFDTYSEGDYVAVRVHTPDEIQGSILELYLETNEGWPTRIRALRDFITLG